MECRRRRFPFVRAEVILHKEKIKQLISGRGIGFVEGDRGELFFQHPDINGVPSEELRERQMLKFEIGQDR
jgi:cold shock CspA family protein